MTGSPESLQTQPRRCLTHQLPLRSPSLESQGGKTASGRDAAPPSSSTAVISVSPQNIIAFLSSGFLKGGLLFPLAG